MNETIFVDRVKKYFHWLETEYGFKTSLEKNSEIRPETDGVVEYISSTTVVVIDSETGSATAWFYRIKDGKRYYLTPIDIFEYLNTDDKEKELLLSPNPKDQPEAKALFDRKFLLNQPEWQSEKEGTINKLELRLSNYANWLKEYASLCITGNSLQWPKFYEYKILRARADHLRRGKDELGYARVEDSDGNWKLIKQSIFKDKLEHIEKLKKEFSS